MDEIISQISKMSPLLCEMMRTTVGVELGAVQKSAVCTFFSLFPAGLAALLRSAGFFSGVVLFARMTLAFHGFQIGLKKCKSDA